MTGLDDFLLLVLLQLEFGYNPANSCRAASSAPSSNANKKNIPGSFARVVLAPIPMFMIQDVSQAALH